MPPFTIHPYHPAHRPHLLTIWERSVLATHHFLASEDFEHIKALVQTIDFTHFEVYCLFDDTQMTGFVGVADRKVEMLFIDPNFFGKGMGKQLMTFAIQQLRADKVDVNEANTQAVGFYKLLGFEVYERTEKDDQGNNYPLLRMRLIPPVGDSDK